MRLDALEEGARETTNPGPGGGDRFPQVCGSHRFDSMAGRSLQEAISAAVAAGKTPLYVCATGVGTQELHPTLNRVLPSEGLDTEVQVLASGSHYDSANNPFGGVTS